MTFGEKLFVALANARTAAPNNVLTKDAWIAKANEVAHTEGITKKKKPKGAARARNPLWDALALATGSKNLDQITRNAAKAIGVALADIQSVTPDLTVEELNRRAAAYKRRWTDPRNLSAQALAKHWGEFAPMAGEAKTAAAMHDVYQEPAAQSWHLAAIALYGDEVAAQMKEKGWFNFGTDFRAAILRELARPKQGAA